MAPLSRQARRLFSVLISLTCLSLTPAQTPPHESLWLPHWAPRFSSLQFGFLCFTVPIVKYGCHTHCHFSYN